MSQVPTEEELKAAQKVMAYWTGKTRETTRDGPYRLVRRLPLTAKDEATREEEETIAMDVIRRYYAHHPQAFADLKKTTKK